MVDMQERHLLVLLTKNEEYLLGKGSSLSQSLIIITKSHHYHKVSIAMKTILVLNYCLNNLDIHVYISSTWYEKVNPRNHTTAVNSLNKGH